MVSSARLATGLTQTECANFLSLTQGRLSKIEDGLVMEVPLKAIEKLSEITGFPVPFFSQPGNSKSLGDQFFRKCKVVQVKHLKKFDALVNIKRLEVEKLLPKVEFDFVDRPHWEPEDFQGGAREIARHLRAFWGIPKGPIADLTKIIEDAGCIVIHFDFGSPKIDGLNTYTSDGTPLIFVNSKVSAARLRATLAHELGHVIMHRVPTPQMEDEAFDFAAEFLMPEMEIRPSFFPLNIEKLVDLKRRWRVSISWLLRWAKNMGALKDNYYRFLQMKLSQAGWRKSEPLDDEWPLEIPHLLREIIDFHKKDLGYSDLDLATLLNPNRNSFRREYLGDTGLRIV